MSPRPANPGAAPPRFTTLGELKKIKKLLAEQAAQAAQQEALRREQERQRQQQAIERNLFRHAVGRVRPLAEHGRADLRPEPPRPLPVQKELDDAAALQEALSDEVDITTLLETDEHLSFRRPGVGMDVTHKLRRGRWSIQAQVDLHGLRSDEARQTLADFIRQAHRAGLRCVRVVHGKGLGSPGKTPVLKAKVQRWLVQKNEVIAFVQAAPSHGGAGALVVLLQSQRPQTNAKHLPKPDASH
ncbi:Smr/MutS family protein [Curvibacter sp. CHRR-16]|uniref:Smr/MutS family protein n=1 Tax=Curvibacter sp. CHRR-16 TaxID=2835872 RepID=UPI001BDB5743|nr:Smr/MutS family protein [Curvibacter sp. CHRR-16]MBT0569185.1 Smr/MutS family protein [Curvibacter sp. CHRR-16]